MRRWRRRLAQEAAAALGAGDGGGGARQWRRCREAPAAGQHESGEENQDWRLGFSFLDF